MRKFYSLLLMLLVSVGAWAQEQSLPFTPSNAPVDGAWDLNTKWYFINFPNSDAYHSGGYLAAEGSDFLSTTKFDSGKSNGYLLIKQTEKPIKYSALWCLVGDEENGFTFYNRINPNLKLGFSGGKAWLYDASKTYSDVYFSFKHDFSTSAKYPGKSVFYYTTNTAEGGTTKNYWNNQDAGGSYSDYLTKWNSDYGLSDNGSAINIEAVTEEELSQMVPVTPEVSTSGTKNYYLIKSQRSGKYATYTSDQGNITLTDISSFESLSSKLWYVTEGTGDGVYLQNKMTSKKYAGNNKTVASFTDDGIMIYIKENPYCAGYVYISKTSPYSSNSCWDEQTTAVGTWDPRVADYEGTSWSYVPYTTEEAKEFLNNAIRYMQEYFNGAVGHYNLSASDMTEFNAAIVTAQNTYNSSSSTVDDCMNECDNLFAFKEKESKTIVTPTTGKFYRFKSKYDSKYIQASSNGSQFGMATLNDNSFDHASVFYLTTDNKFLNFKSGTYLKETSYQGNVGDDGNMISFFASEGDNLGYFTLKSDYTGSKYLDNNSGTGKLDRRGSYSATGSCDWEVVEVEYLPVPMNAAAGYATLYSPVQLSLTNRVEAYAVSEVAETSVKLQSLENIPANEGVILKIKNVGDIVRNCVFLQVTGSGATVTSNKLEGTLASTMFSDEAYVLANVDSKVGLYKAAKNQDSDTKWINNGFRAYLPVSTPGARVLTFNFDDNAETGISAVEIEEAAPANAAIYDLSGRRVQSAKSGLYIINGKKVIK